uniref:Uncharacterized protein n=1 Tax=viral metagenome TaxID=1070528 RepID=A0A6C0DIG6_9ZZZZ
MTQTSSAPGMVYPTIQAMRGPTWRESSMMSMNDSNQKLNNLIKATSGGKRIKTKSNKNKRGGYSKGIVVPQFPSMYPNQSAQQAPNDSISSLSKTSTQGAANRVFDNEALVLHGGNVYVNPNTNQYQWGCYSGGKKYYRKYRKHIKKTKKIRRKRTKKTTRRGI